MRVPISLCCVAAAWTVAVWSLAALGQQTLSVDHPGSVTVNALAYSLTPSGSASGNCSPVRVTAESWNSDAVRVGFFESEAGGSGGQWRSAGWTAAVTAALLTDFNPRSARVSFEYEGRVDGASAGALMTVGVVAAVRGDAVRPDVAMTGTINPDGTIGPVGGLVHKIQGAALAGMKTVLIPAGIRFDRDQNTKEQVDLFELGQKLGVEVRGVFDIYAAYELLTGSVLDRPEPAEAPRVDGEVQKRIQQKLDVWQQYYADSLATFAKLPESARNWPEVAELRRHATRIMADSDQLKIEGEFSAALWDRVGATVNGYLALEEGRCRQTYTSRGYAGLVTRIRDNGWLENDVQKMAGRMRTETPKTLDQLSMYMGACDAFLECLSLQQVAKKSLAALPANGSKEALAQAGDAADNQIVAWLNLRLAGDCLDLMAAYDQGRPIPHRAPWRQTADYLRRASQANLAVFDTIVVESSAKNLAQSAEQLRATLMQKDEAYAIARAADQEVFGRLSQYFGEGDALGYASLAASIYTHATAASLLAKYYSLGAELDDTGKVVRFARERTLADWLNYAEDQARRNVALLQSQGVNVSPCALRYEVARVKAHRGSGDKVGALYDFWAIDLHSQVLRRISAAGVEE